MPRKPKSSEPKHGVDGHPLNGNLSGQLKGYVSEIERVEDERALLKADVDEIYGSAKEAGFDTKAIRALVKRRAADKAKLKVFEDTLASYELALGDLATTPLGQAAIARAGVAA